MMSAKNRGNTSVPKQVTSGNLKNQKVQDNVSAGAPPSAGGQTSGETQYKRMGKPNDAGKVESLQGFPSEGAASNGIKHPIG